VADECGQFGSDGQSSGKQCNPDYMPCITSLEAFERAAARFEITELELIIEPSAGAAVRRFQEDGSLILELPAATEAIVPHRPRRWPQFSRTAP
jgi:hypothetical protein